MKRKELEKAIAKIAKDKKLKAVYTEGGNHTKVSVGGNVTFIPRHKEMARDILNVLKGN